MKPIRHLGDFLREEMRKRDMGIYTFGEFVGVSHMTIHKFSSFGEKEINYPTIEFLVKLAAATQTDIRYIISLVAPPSVLADTNIDPEFLKLGEQIRQLPEGYQKVIREIIELGLANKSQ